MPSRSSTIRRSRITAIVDTNVVLDIISCHDVIDGFSRSQKHAWWRLEQAAYGLRLSIYLNAISARTLSAGNEAIEIATKLVPPEVNSLSGWYLRSWFFFTKDKILPKWWTGSVNVEGKGNDVDDALIELARQHKRPLISNEGRGPDGLSRNQRMRLRAQAAGVVLVTPEQFCRGRVSRTKIKRFLREFKARGPSFCRQSPLYSNVQHHLAGVYDYYAKLLLGTDPSAIAEREARTTS